MKFVLIFFLIVSLLVILCTIRLNTPPPSEVVQAQPSATITHLDIRPSPPPTLTPTPLIPDTGWTPLRLGLERRIINLLDEEGKLLENIYLLRLDPSLYRFDVAYHPTEPRSLADWQAQTGALIVLNGGYYREEENRLIPNGLTVIDGRPIGQSFGDFAGMFAVTEAGPELRWLRQQPYNPAETLRAALQSFPLLIKPGGVLGFSAESEDGKQARRTALAQDTDGRILLLVTSRGYFTLHTLSRYLTESDLTLDIALNLDGGTSSGLLLADPAEAIPALLPLPIVIVVYEK